VETPVQLFKEKKGTAVQVCHQINNQPVYRTSGERRKATKGGRGNDSQALETTITTRPAHVQIWQRGLVLERRKA
jgi:hypothetical protein